MWYYLRKKNDPNFCFFIHQSPLMIKTLIFLFSLLRKMCQNRWVNTGHRFYFSISPISQDHCEQGRGGEEHRQQPWPPFHTASAKIIRTTGITDPHCLKMIMNRKKLSRYRFYLPGLLTHIDGIVCVKQIGLGSARTLKIY